MRVLTVGNRYPPAGTGGYERVWQAAVLGLRAAGHEATVLTTDGGSDEDEPGVHRALRWTWTPAGWNRPGPLAAARQERHNAAAFAELARGVDLVAWFSMGGLSLSLIARCRAPQLAVVHDGWPLYGPGVDPWTARWGRGARHRYDPQRVDHWSANSAYTRARILAALPVLDPGRVSVEHPGIDPAAFPASPAREWTGELLVLGRIEKEKGVADAIRARPEGMRLTLTGPADPAHLVELAAIAGRGEVVV
nr:glycosyltransferase family 4 protein [Solirubrobacterales bacterium]